MSTRTSSQANFSSNRPRKRQKRSSGLKTPTNWDPYSNAPIPVDTDGFLFCDRIKGIIIIPCIHPCTGKMQY